MNKYLLTSILTIAVLLTVENGYGQTTETNISNYGLALPKDNVVMRSHIDSHVTRLLVREGQIVKKGDVLVELGCQSAIAKKKIAELAAQESGSRMNASAELKYARVSFKKISTLFDKKAVNEKEFDESQLRLESAEARHRIEEEQQAAKQAQFELANVELQEFYLKAPFDGQITQIKVSIGDAVSSNTDILQIIAADVLRVELYVPIKKSSKFQVGDTCKLQVHQPFEDRQLDARIIFRSPMIEATTGTLRIMLELDNKDLQLPAGFTVSLAD